jgi:hypothetical protein
VRLRAATAPLEITPKLQRNVEQAARLGELEQPVAELRVGV